MFVAKSRDDAPRDQPIVSYFFIFDVITTLSNAKSIAKTCHAHLYLPKLIRRTLNQDRFALAIAFSHNVAQNLTCIPLFLYIIKHYFLQLL